MKKLAIIIAMLLIATQAHAVTISVDLEVPQAVIDAGGIELFASAYGWTPKIIDPNDNTKTIDNPVSALDAGKAVVKEFVKQVTKAKYMELARKQSEELASSNFDNMFVE